MPYVEIPKDLSEIKTKVAFHLTKRQLICFSLAGMVGVPVYLFSRNWLGNDIAVTVMIFLMLPFFLMALFEKDGQPFEKFLFHIISLQFSHAIRVYKTHNFYDTLQKSEPEREEKPIAKKPKRKKYKKTRKKHSKPTRAIKKRPPGNQTYENIRRKKQQ